MDDLGETGTLDEKANCSNQLLPTALLEYRTGAQATFRYKGEKVIPQDTVISRDDCFDAIIER